MRFDREVLIGRLHEIGAADPTAFGSEVALILKTAEVFDDGITVNDVERIIRERQPPRVAHDPLKLTAPLTLDGQI